MRRFRLWNALSSSLWFIPLLCVFAGVALSFGTIAIDRTANTFVPRSLSGDPDAARAILTTVAMSMVTLTGLVLTITMVVVQLAMGQFTPRVLRTILRDRPSQFAIGIFVATFAHSMLVLREVEAPTTANPQGFVPGLAIVVSFVLIIVSIMVLVSYVHHIGQSLRVASLIDSVGDDARDLLGKVYPHDADHEDIHGELPGGKPTQIVAARVPGVVYKLATGEIVEAATSAEAVVQLVPRMGDFVPEGAPVFMVYGGRIDEKVLLSKIALGKERTLHEDLAYGFRLLVDVAVRSLSSSMGDPTTAVQAIDRLHDCLRQLATRPFPSGTYADTRGRLRFVVPVISWEGYVHVVFDELRSYAMSSLQVTRRLVAMLDDLERVAPAERRAPLREQRELLQGRVERSVDYEDAPRAIVADQQGVGSGRDAISPATTQSATGGV